jgi:hypothetical protein
MLGNFPAIPNRFFICIEIDPNSISMRDAIFHIEEEFLHIVTSEDTNPARQDSFRAAGKRRPLRSEPLPNDALNYARPDARRLRRPMNGRSKMPPLLGRYFMTDLQRQARRERKNSRRKGRDRAGIVQQRTASQTGAIAKKRPATSRPGLRFLSSQISSR